VASCVPVVPAAFDALNDLVAILPRDLLEWLAGAAINRLDALDGDPDLEIDHEDCCVSDLPHD
jgi:hypothetical protein